MAWLTPLEPDEEGRRRFQLVSPLDGSETSTLTCANAADVDAAMVRARKAAKIWGQTPVRERVKLMDRALATLVRRQDHVMEVIRAETGRAEAELVFMGILAVCDTMNFYSRRAAKVLADQKTGLHLMRTKKATIVYKPMGVVAVISPWNGPFALTMNSTIQALLAGNAVLIKPSEATPQSGGSIVEELFREAGFPQNLVQVVQGDGEAGAALIAAGPDKVCFTGSVRTGKRVAVGCAERLIPCTLELGGKDPMIICSDADLERAAGAAVFGAMMNAGQYCSGTERVYVVQSVAEAFTEKVIARVRALELGRDIGPFIHKPQLDIVEAHVEDAVAKGAVVAVGGKRQDGFFQPTVLTGVTHAMDVMTEETFGPVLPIMVVPHEDDALKMANDSRFGLGASVFSKNKARANQMARELHCGSVSLNDAAVTFGALEVPFGGVRESGVGQVNGADGLRNFVHAQPILTERIAPSQEWIWYPYTDEKVAQLKKAVWWMFGSPLRWIMR